MSDKNQPTEKIELPDKDARAATEQAGTTGTTERIPTSEPTARIEVTEPAAPAPMAPRPPAPVYQERPPAPTGPHGPAIILGIVLLGVAAFALSDALLDLQIDWAVTGPIGIVVVGAVLLVLGAVGLASNRRR